MRHAVAAVLLVTLAAFIPLNRLHAQPTQDFLALARAAIADPGTLASVRSLYLEVAPRGAMSGAGTPPLPAFGDQGFDPAKSIEAPARRERTVSRQWLAPPSRYLIRRGAQAVGIDAGRLITIGFPKGRSPAIDPGHRLRHMALELLLYDPDALGLRLHDLGARQVGRRQFHALEATAGDFDMVLYFDPASHRLAMSDDVSPAPGETMSGMTRPVPQPGVEQTPRAERETYGSFRRVDGVELPFSLTTQTAGGKNSGRAQRFDVVKYVVNPSDLDRQFQP